VTLRLRGSLFTEPLPRSGLQNPVVPLLRERIAGVPIDPLPSNAPAIHVTLLFSAFCKYFILCAKKLQILKTQQ
jgi:hypothetical protein